MDSRIAFLVLIIVIGSGCTESREPGGRPIGEIYLEEFSAEETELDPGQVTEVKAVFKNEKDESTTLRAEDVRLFNTGEMKIKEKICRPEEIKSASQGFSPEMECVWQVEAPGEDWIKGFGSKPLSINMVFNYSTTIEPSEPLTIEFREDEEAVKREDVTQELSDGKVRVRVEGRSPLPVNSDYDVQIRAENQGVGELKGIYSFDYTPQSIIKEEAACPSEKKPIDGEAEFECTLNTGLEGERKFFVTTSYKYQEIANTIIEVSE